MPEIYNLHPLLKQIRIWKHSRYAKYKIQDFSRRAPMSKHVETGSQMVLLQALLDTAREEKLARVVLVGDYMRDSIWLSRFMEAKKLMPPYRMIPSWEAAPYSTWLACMQMTLILSGPDKVWCYSADIRDDVISSAMSSIRKSPASFYHNRVLREFNKLGDADFWQAIDINDDGKHHLHGGVLFESDVPSKEIGYALRRACGEFEPSKRARQTDRDRPLVVNELNWAFYARKKPIRVQRHYGIRPFSYSQGLAQDGRELYNLSRAFLNEHRRAKR